jgi:hypothetical protein
LEMDGPVICRRDAVVYQAIYSLYNKAVYQKANELEGRDRGSGGVCDGANVGGAEGAGLDKYEETADGKQGRRGNVSRRAVVDEVEGAVEIGPRA